MPKGVHHISKQAFDNNDLKNVTLHNEILTIEQEAFSDNKLTSLTIPDSVKAIHKEAFRNIKCNIFDALSLHFA
ncbi:MAG: leucine-rich repeat domain-containing protein [Treponema sp.]|nr:leucine-rich repeat domain-containing protein [Treponema sp.]